MSLPFIREFRLAGPKGDGRHAYVNKDGAFIGRGVPLLERDSSGRWRPRGNGVLERLFGKGKGYGIPIELGWRATQLHYVAQALNKGDLALACISLVRAELPPLPSWDRACAMAKADGLLVKYNPDWEDEPRIPEGDPAGRQWTGDGEDRVSDDGAPLTFVSNGGASAGSKTSAQGTTVTIEHPDGTTEVRRGGSVTWRANNPGAIQPGAFADRHGAIGSTNGHAIFPDEATGHAAQRALLVSPGYRNLTMDEAVARWSPPSENDTQKYQALVQQWTGLSGNAKIRDMSQDQVASLMAAQR